MRFSIISAGVFAVATTGIAGSAAAAKAPDPEIRVFKPVADTYVSAARPLTNFGSATVLRVDGSPEATAFIRFELKKIRGKTASVTLLLHSRTPGRAAYAVRRVSDDDWRERRLTYETAPQPSLRYVSSSVVRPGAWSAIDVSSFVRGGGDVSFAITTYGTKQLVFVSRESRYGPRLVVRSHEGDDKDDVEDDIVEDSG
jgi:hypothetical protein